MAARQQRQNGAMLAARVGRTRDRMTELGVDALLLSVGPDLPWLKGYTAMPLERLTMLVLPREGDAVLLVPRLEAPRVVERPDVFTLRPWDETDDPIALVAGLVGPGWRLAVGDRTWARCVPARTPPRSRPCAGPRPRSTASPASCRAG